MMRLFIILCICFFTTASVREGLGAEKAATPAAKKPVAPHIPTVLLSKQDASLCRLKVGDKMPAIALPQVGGGEKKLADLYGKKATFVVFWKSDRRMAQQQLADLGPDIIKPFGEKGVAVVGIAVKETAESASAALKKAGADFSNLLDADGEAFAQVGSERLPRTYLLDPQGKILWFDIEYSVGTRRELRHALRFIAGNGTVAAGDRRFECD
jgi:peroxiredoxin